MGKAWRNVDYGYSAWPDLVIDVILVVAAIAAIYSVT